MVSWGKEIYWEIDRWKRMAWTFKVIGGRANVSFWFLGKGIY